MMGECFEGWKRSSQPLGRLGLDVVVPSRTGPGGQCVQRRGAQASLVTLPAMPPLSTQVGTSPLGDELVFV